jgi:hypothetical protein
MIFSLILNLPIKRPSVQKTLHFSAIRLVCGYRPINRQYMAIFLFFSLFWNHERHDQRNRVTTALGAKQEGLTIVQFLNKLIVSCKEAVRFPFYFYFFGGGIFKLDSYWQCFYQEVANLLFKVLTRQILYPKCSRMHHFASFRVPLPLLVCRGEIWMTEHP